VGVNKSEKLSLKSTWQ